MSRRRQRTWRTRSRHGRIILEKAFAERSKMRRINRGGAEAAEQKAAEPEAVEQKAAEQDAVEAEVPIRRWHAELEASSHLVEAVDFGTQVTWPPGLDELKARRLIHRAVTWPLTVWSRRMQL